MTTLLPSSAPHQASAIDYDSGAVVEDTIPRIADAMLGSLAESDCVESHVAEADMAGFTNLIREVEFYVHSTLFILRALFGK